MPTREEWIEIHKQERVAEGCSLAEQEMLQTLAGIVVVERLQRSVIVGTTKSGRLISERVGEPGEAEVKLTEIMASKARPPRVIEGGPHIGTVIK